jgi:hypothetical protein
MAEYVVSCIDGTDSASWRKSPTWQQYSHVRAFHVGFGNGPGKHNAYHEGPHITGWDVDTIFGEAYAYIEKSVKSLQGKGITFRPSVQSCSTIIKPDFGGEIVLVGHSRGAVIAGDLARHIGKELKLGVYFLGLYDAVDRSAIGSAGEGGSGGGVENVVLTCHARRNQTSTNDPALSMRSSQTSFGNDYTFSVTGFYRERYFDTNHGGIGGAPDLDYETVNKWIGDMTCIAPTSTQIKTEYYYQRKAEKAEKHKDFADSTRRYQQMYEATRRQIDVRRQAVRTCIDQSKLVQKWMIGEACGAALPVRIMRFGNPTTTPSR